MNPAFEIVPDPQNPLRLTTKGLREIGQDEIASEVSRFELLPGNESFLRFIGNYVLAQDKRIRAGQTMGYGYWTVRFAADPSGFLTAEEHDPRDLSFVPGVSYAVSVWERQREECVHRRTDFNPPRPDQYVMISPDAVTADTPVDAVRYPSPQHMSGWWLSSPDYSGPVSSMLRQHLYHLTDSRPELVQYLALPPGYRFQWDAGKASARFDPAVATEDAV